MKIKKKPFAKSLGGLAKRQGKINGYDINPISYIIT